MKRIALTLASLALASAAWAHNCPNEMKAIDAALPKAKLRAEGEQLHKAGKHNESMAALGKAKGILGIK
jgi:hypothetical protein